jgi:hypothetical protein
VGTVVCDAVALRGGERDGSPVDAVAGQTGAPPDHLRLRGVTEQVNLRHRIRTGTLIFDGFGDGMAHTAPVGK